jgi:membrane protein implicated in regulation of membrane protease activity
MTWELFYLVCFVVGLLLSALSLLGGMGHIGWHIHAPHMPHPGHIPTVAHIPHGLPHAAYVPQTAPGQPSAQGTATVPWWNAFSIMVFLCWFGAAGYLLTRYGSFVAAVVVVLALVCGVAGGAIVFFFLAKVLLPHERELTADETAVIGVVGRVSAPIRAAGTGEMVYEQLGALRSAPARSEDGVPIQKQEEVFVVRYEKGIAYVRRWEDLPEIGQEQGTREQGTGPASFPGNQERRTRTSVPCSLIPVP